MQQFELEQSQFGNQQFNQNNNSGFYSEINSEYSNDAYIFREEDIKTIIDDYNHQIRELLEDNQILKEKNAFLKQKSKSTDIENYFQLNKKLDQQRQNLQLNAEKLEQNFFDFIKECKTKINSIIQQEKPQILQQNIITVPETPEKSKTFKEKKIESLEQIAQLIEQNTQLQLKVIKYFGEKGRIRVCGRCGQKYSPLENHETSCQYHPGRLKYYSCLGCGGDEYYSCCMKCSNCSKGCRFDKHVTQE